MEHSTSLEDFLNDLYHSGDSAADISKTIQQKIDLIQQLCEEWLTSLHGVVDKSLVKVLIRYSMKIDS